MLDFNNKKITLSVGLVALLLLFFLLFNSDSKSGSYNTYYAIIPSVDGVSKNQNVSVGGFAVGFINNMVLNDDNKVILELKVNKDIKIATDSIVSLNADSLIAANKNVNIIMGVDIDYLEDGDIIYNSFFGLDLNQILIIISNYIKGKQSNEK